MVGSAHAQALQQRLIGKGALEPLSGVLDETIQEDQGSDLSMNIAILELLADGSRSLAGARGLELDDFNEVGDAAQVLLFV